MGSVSSEHSQSFSCLIVGAGIGGLAAAIALSRRGFQVTILEAKAELNEFGASIGISPYAVRILQNYGLEAAFRPHICEEDSMEIRDGHSNEVIGRVVQNLGHTAKLRWNAPAWVIHRADYQQLLAAGAKKHGAQILFSAEAVHVDVKTQTVSLKDGRTLTADLVVGADGLRSHVRHSIPATASAKMIADPELAYRCSVLKDRMRSNPLLNDLLDDPNTKGWFMEGKSVLAWRLPEDRDYDVVACRTSEIDLPLGSWGTPAQPAEVATHFEDANPQVRELLAQLGPCIQWRIAELEPLSTCRSLNGQTVLIGDAWHAMLPHNASAGGQAIEDGAVLAECMAWAAENKRSVADATEAFEKLRTVRVRRIQDQSRAGRGFMNAAGEARELRNTRLKAQTDASYLDLQKPFEQRRRELPEPDISAYWPSAPYLQWLFAYDAVKETNQYLSTLL